MSPNTDNAVTLAPRRYVTIDLAAVVTGYSPGAIRTKIARGVWLQDRLWKYASDGRVLIDLEGYDQWAAQATE